MTARFYFHKPIQMLMFGFCLVSLLPSTGIQAAEEPTAAPKAIKKVTLLGLDLIEADVKEVRTHLSAIGGFLQAKSTIKQRNLDRFFTWSRIRDSYYLQFRYNHAGKVTSVTRLYRPYSIENSNRRTNIGTKDVARQLTEHLGQKPTSAKRKGWGGTLSYTAYTWQDEKITITVDRQGSEKLGNVFVKYTINNHDPYEVIKDKKV